MMESNDADSLLKTPAINKIPGTISARAIGICIYGGSPMFGKKFANPGFSFDIP